MIFRNWVLQNFPFLEDDFDALTDYELFCKMVEYMKKSLEKVEDFQNEINGFEVKLNEFQNYFDNLDVQEEINNKLDEMVADGTMEELIGEYLQLVSTYTYNSVAEMKQATNLVNGSFTRTSGYYSYNDGGGCLYKVRQVTNEDVIDDILVIALSNNNLVAELLKQDLMNIKQFGAKGDGINDDTINIQKAFNFTNNIIIKDGIYMVDSLVSLKPQNNSYIKIANATLKAITTNEGNYAILYLNQVSNVIIDGGIIEGERDTHAGTTGEWGYCIRIDNGNNITIKNSILKNAWGDGLYINGGNNINTQNIICDNNRRQGISVIKVNGYHSLNDKLININGTAPQSGIDIEPNYPTDYIQNIILENLYTENNMGAGISLYLFNQDDTSENISIKIINHHDKGSKEGQHISINKLVRHNIIIENSLLENNNYGMNLYDCYDNGIDKIQIIRPKIVNCNYDTSNTLRYICGIACYTNTNTSDNLGGFSIIEPFITSMFDTNRAGMYLYDDHNNVKLNNVDIINPLNKQSNLRLILYGQNVIVKDMYNKYKNEGNYNFTINYNELFISLSNKNYSTSRTITLQDSIPIGFEITFTNEKGSNPLKVQMANTEYVRYFNDNTGNLISLNGINATITLKHIDEHEWLVTNLIGNVSI